MSQHTRRTFLKVSGAMIGGIAAGSTAVAAESTDRFVVDARHVGDADLDAADADVPGWYYDLVLSTLPGDDYGWKAGTSMAAPQVTAAAALLKSQNPELNANQVESTLKRTASVPEGYDKSCYGAGFLDLLGALEN